MNPQGLISKYLNEVERYFSSGQAGEHAYRPALKELMESFDDTSAVNDPKRSQHGMPDFVFLKRSNSKIIKGYAEAKDIKPDILDKTEKTEQMERYHGYANLFLTDYLEFRFFKNGEKYKTISLGKLKDGHLSLNPENSEELVRELKEFLELPPEQIKSGRRLAEIMGGKARRIRDNVSLYLDDEHERNQELEKMYSMMKELLVHDLSKEKFADMYAQTLVYGLFVARYGDRTPDNFTRQEARDLVPKSNPFLRKFFDHIAGSEFDDRLGYIVDELCEVFQVSNVKELIKKHLKLIEFGDGQGDEKDPIIHFYEDFLKEYDPLERKRMGAYYTPIPVVKFMINQVDRILKEEFKLGKGLADTSKIDHITKDASGKRFKNQIHRVQILDPAVGTATFLNETIKFIYEGFEGQEGCWPSYAERDLLPRLHGFELMMAPYTIAHLKLGMTLQETGLMDYTDRLGVYLTNTLEEGIPRQPDLFSYGLAEAVTQESAKAAEIKHEKPIMVIIGNPPYSISSNNKGDHILNLIKDYKKDLNERKINLDDDYIKFIRFAEDQIAKNGEGIVAMITNNSYIDGITHRQMRKHLLQTFDKILVVDLHGNSKKKETSPDGTKDENVFDIMQGVSIVFMIKFGKKKNNQLGEIYHSELYGKRKIKFSSLLNKDIKFSKLEAPAPAHFFVPKDFILQKDYDNYISLNQLFVLNSSGIHT
ncbi:MAG TPA: N-6 DNA methylase, partial [Candidatus Saccharimonadales bacterium]|nr:N-6 DNA methylase [Candidatus Saccharimonadales bacterium]